MGGNFFAPLLRPHCGAGCIALPAAGFCGRAAAPAASPVCHLPLCGISRFFAGERENEPSFRGPQARRFGGDGKNGFPFGARQERTGGCSAEFWPQKAGRRGRSICPGQQSGAFCAFLTSNLQDRTARTGRSVHRTGSRRRGVFPSIFAPKTTRAAAPFFRVRRGNEDV